MPQNASEKTYDSGPETREHIAQVARRLKVVCDELHRRGVMHDASKLGPEEKPIFDEMTPKLKELTYGTDEYRAALKALGPALDHHYRKNSHHPEHYAHVIPGIKGFDLFDLVEMYCDWCAAALRTKDGDVGKSLDHNAKRFQLDPQLVDILRNTWVRDGGMTGWEQVATPSFQEPWEKLAAISHITLGDGKKVYRKARGNPPLNERCE